MCMEDGTLKSLGHCEGTDLPEDALQWDFREGCEVRQVLDRMSDRWSLVSWTDAHGQEIAAAREEFDRRSDAHAASAAA